MKRAQLATVTAAGLLMFAGCSSSDDGPGAAAVTESVTETPSPTAAAWPISESTGGTGSGPDFPEALDGWRLKQEWNVLERAFTHSWTDGSGPEYEPFPSTMNGCDTSLFLLRWRAISDTAQVVSGWTYSSHLPERLAPASAGWMVLDGCATPRWRLESVPGGTLVDVTVDVQHWTPAP